MLAATDQNCKNKGAGGRAFIAAQRLRQRAGPCVPAVHSEALAGWACQDVQVAAVSCSWGLGRPGIDYSSPPSVSHALVGNAEWVVVVQGVHGDVERRCRAIGESLGRYVRVMRCVAVDDVVAARRRIEHARLKADSVVTLSANRSCTGPTDTRLPRGRRL